MTESKNILEGEAVVLFSPVLAKAFGNCGALLIQQIHYWVSVSPHHRDEAGGFNWHYNTYDKWAAQLGYSAREIRRTTKKLADLNVISVGVFNRHKYDRTPWYRIDYDGLCRAMEVLSGGMWQVRTDSNGHKGHLHVARMSAPIPETPSETPSQSQTCELMFATGRAEGIKTQPAGEDQGEQAGVKHAAKPSFVLEAHWYACMALLPGERHHKQLTQKERGQLKMLASAVGFDNVKAVIGFALKRWEKYCARVQLVAGLSKYPIEPHIGFLLKYQHVAVKMRAQSLESVAKPVEATSPIAVVTMPPPPAEKEEPYVPSPEELAATLAMFDPEVIKKKAAMKKSGDLLGVLG